MWRNGSKRKRERAWTAIQCGGCGCGWRGGLSDESQDYMRDIVTQGWGLVKIPDCPGCPCHTGVGLLPRIRIFES